MKTSTLLIGLVVAGVVYYFYKQSSTSTSTANNSNSFLNDLESGNFSQAFSQGVNDLNQLGVFNGSSATAGNTNPTGAISPDQAFLNGTIPDPAENDNLPAQSNPADVAGEESN